MQKSTTKNTKETQEVAQHFAGKILAGGLQKTAIVLALRGDLGAGKTTFLQGFARGLGIQEVINSPTFVIMKKFKISHANFKFFYHFDLYRLESESDVEFLHIKEIISDPQNIVAIEWPEKIKELLPEIAININFSHVQENSREIIVG